MSSAVTRPESTASGRICRFGAFEFREQARELRKHGLRIKLSGQPISVLAMLLERPGEVITREELQNHLWPAGTYVDFEHSVNAAIKRLRQALGDSADSPRSLKRSPVTDIASSLQSQPQTGCFEAAHRLLRRTRRRRTAFPSDTGLLRPPFL